MKLALGFVLEKKIENGHFNHLFSMLFVKDVQLHFYLYVKIL